MNSPAVKLTSKPASKKGSRPLSSARFSDALPQTLKKDTDEGVRPPVLESPQKLNGPAKNKTDDASTLLERYGCGPIQFVGSDNASYERHLIFDNVIALDAAGPRERFEAFARSVRDVLSQRWVRTEETYARENPKRVYYLSMEYLIGRSLANNITNLLLEPVSREAEKQKHLDLVEIVEQEPDAGLG